jgi:hypothetical protein
MLEMYLLAQLEPMMASCASGKRAARLTASVESEPHDYACRVDVVSPEQLEAELDLGEVRMRVGVWACRFYGAVPNWGTYGCHMS